MKSTLFTLIKLSIRELIRQNYDVSMDIPTALDNGCLVSQENSLLFDQIERLRGKPTSHIEEIILVVAKKNPKQENALKHILTNGFLFNGIHYSRFGKSASQGKDGITAFVCDKIFDELYRITQMDIDVKECVISKYEAQRCLLFSSCTPIHDYMPNIVIIDEYQKTLRHQLINYVVKKEREFVHPENGERKTYKAREIEEGYRDIPLSPFDGCGCHEREFMEKVSTQLELDYQAAGVQIRLPFMKGYSVYVPFREILAKWGYKYITDIYGHKHPVESIDCIWNISMFKGHHLFFEKYGNNAWTAYMQTLRKYAFKLGISKYSHHVRHLPRFTRMNFQYLQCLNLWNPKYIEAFVNKDMKNYDILNEDNDGKIIALAKYTTSLFEKIINGEPFYTFKFMGITNTDEAEPESRYLEAALVNRAMLKDPAVKQFVYRKLKKAIDEARVGKIYCSGFYHTGIGDMIGYLQYAAGEKPTGCLRAGELYSGNFPCGDIVSFRSPLVDPSEVNKVKLVQNDMINQWFSYLRGQDIVMFNMYDLSAPQQGGADFDGDIFFLCDDPVVIHSKIDKRIVLDIEDKATSQIKPYTKENIAEYEVMTRDSRIGEITNAATSIENRYTTDEEVKQLYSAYSSLLRIFQGKEIDFLKTGVRWHMNNGLRKHLKQLPYFLLYLYPDKLDKYKRLSEKNKQTENKEDKVLLNAYHSPSPMNELCHYICTWEKQKILWEHRKDDLTDTSSLILNPHLDLTDRKIMKIVRRTINGYADEIRRQINLYREESDNEALRLNMERTVSRFKHNLSDELQMEEEIIANYVICVSYSRISISKSLAWAGYSDYIIKNLKTNSAGGQSFFIREVPEQTETSYEYLGKYYEYTEGEN